MYQRLYDILNLIERVDHVKGYSTLSGYTREMLLEAASLEDVYTKYYSQMPQDDFLKIVKADPTAGDNKMGKYSQWLLRLYQNGKLKLEDLYKATEDLTLFHKYKAKLQQKDISQYGSLDQLFNAVEPFRDNTQAASKSEEIRNIKQRGAEKVYDDGEWMVVVPKTKEAAIYYGKNTRWCTAAESGSNMFDNYNSEGSLYININKQTGKKFQFHFESKQFMDAQDRPVTNSQVGLSDRLIEFYVSRYKGLFFRFLADDYDNIIYWFERLVGEGADYDDIFDEVDRCQADDNVMVGKFSIGRNAYYGEDSYYLLLNSNGSLLSDTIFNDIGEESDGILPVSEGYQQWNYFDIRNKYYLLDEDVVEADPFEGGVARVCSDDGYNYIKTDGTFISSDFFSECDYSFVDGVTKVVIGKHSYLIDKEGKYLTPPYNYIQSVQQSKRDYNVCIVYNDGNKCNIITRQNNYQPLLKNWYDEIIYCNHPYVLAIVKINDKQNICKPNGEEYFDGFYFNDIKTFGTDGENITKVAVVLSGKFNIVDLEKMQNGKPQFISQTWFDGIKTPFGDGWVGVKIGDKCYFINKEGNYLTENGFDEISWFKYGFAAVRVGEKTNFIRTDGRFVFKDWLENCMSGMYPIVRSYSYKVSNNAEIDAKINGRDALINLRQGIITYPHEWGRSRENY